MNDHRDGVYALERHSRVQSRFLSGSVDGQVMIWDISTQDSLYTLDAHRHWVTDLCCPTSHPDVFFTCSRDATTKLWKFPALGDAASVSGSVTPTPVSVYHGQGSVSGVDHASDSTNFATANMSAVWLWDQSRAEPLNKMSYTAEGWGDNTYTGVHFSPSEPHIVAATASRDVVLFDTRVGKASARVVMTTQTNCLSWNPQAPTRFSIGCNDANAYTFDLRNLSKARTVHPGHVNAVMGIDYSPTGREFSTAGYDTTMRIFAADTPASRDVYYTKRMQKVFCVRYSLDGRFIISGSDDANVRVWKSWASMPLKQQTARQKEAMIYNQRLIKKFSHIPEIASIARHRHLPMHVYKRAKLQRTIRKAATIRSEKDLEHRKYRAQKRQTERTKHIVKFDQ
eukprot:gnl/Dysnectes_brevis/1219_a1363_2502.p1 GENE.gnl/Dysnectes_brevis/1219_a1363_2502~~gnl/Dysnectes_brevis/1219_a1363_2502.p1  ORF type:complete len:462 (-),score=99.10 gnl/Dysnectes_brevis/1219_a1363_2502:151-1341(-)